MAFTKQDYYETGDNSEVGTYFYYQRGQVFTASSSYTITRVSLKVRRLSGYDPGNAKVELFAVDESDHPTGSALADATIDGGTFGTTADWEDWDFSVGYALSSGTKYAIVLSCPDLNNSSLLSVQWRTDTTSPTYTGGADLYSANGGSTWSSLGYDLMFRTYSGSDHVTRELSGTIDGTSSITGILSGVSLDLAGTITGQSSLTGTITPTIPLSGTITSLSTVVGTVTFGPLSGDKAEKVRKYLVAFGNDSVSYESV